MHELIDAITSKRQVKFESERKKPIDELEIYNSVRLKQVKGQNGWELKAGAHRDLWVTLFELAGEPLPKNQIPPPKTQPIQAQYQTQHLSRFPTIYKNSQTMTLKELKPKAYQHKYMPEAGIVIQNTQNIRELYNEEPNPQEKKVSPYEQVINTKFKDVSQTTEYETVQFNTKKYYDEALRLTSDPRSLRNKDTNPIYSFVPVNENFVSNDSRKVSTAGAIGVEKTENDSDSFDEDIQSLEPEEIKRLQSSRFGSVLSIRRGLSSQYDNANFGKIGQLKPMSQQSTKKILDRPMTQQSFKKVTEPSSSAARPYTRTTRDTFHPVDMNNEPVFCTSFKLPTKFDLKKEAAANNPTIKDPYDPPELHKFRDDVPPTNKPLFKVASKAKFYKDKAQVIAEASQPIHISKKEEARIFYENMNFAEKEEKLAELPEWKRYFKHASRERGFLDFQYPAVLKKGSYTEPFLLVNDFLRGEVEYEVPFRLFHRSLRKTDKNLSLGDTVPSKI